MVLNRPPTSKPRGICKYYTSPRGCFAGDTCKFLHGDPSASTQIESPDGCVSPQPLLTPYDSAKTCRYFANGFCKRGSDCWFRHVTGPATKDSDRAGEEDLCSICLERPVTFGLLGGCSHVFCLQCIRQWRDLANKSEDLAGSANTKKCPMCRAPSKFTTPSSRFWKEGEEGKAKVMQTYQESTARVPCRYFQESKSRNSKRPSCPFGKDCFYQHLNDDGTKYVFKEGVDVNMRVHFSQRNRSTYEPNIFGSMDSELNAARRPSTGGIRFFTLDVEHGIDNPSVGGETQRARPRRREQQRGTRSFNVDVTAIVLRELERNLDNIINENSDTDTNVELSLLRENLVENITSLLRRSIEGRLQNSDLVQQLQIITDQFVASIRASSLDSVGTQSQQESSGGPSQPQPHFEPNEENRRSTPPPLEPHEHHYGEPLTESEISPSNHSPDQSSENMANGNGHESPPDPPFVTDGRGRVVWSPESNNSAEA